MSNLMKRSLASLLVATLPAVAWSGQVDINKADARTLARELIGVGKAKAEAIVEYREAHGKFTSPDDLVKIRGIGTKIVDDNRGSIQIVEDEEDEEDKGSAEVEPEGVETEN